MIWWRDCLQGLSSIHLAAYSARGLTASLFTAEHPISASSATEPL
jgi:hypothetical protein